MIHHRSREEVNRYDLFKLIVLLALLALLILVVWQSAGREAVGELNGPTQAATAEIPASSTAAAIIMAAPNLTSPVSTSELTPGAVELNGTGQPGATVRILIDGQPVGDAPIGEDGTWRLPATLAAGAPAVTLQTLDASGNVVNEIGPFVLAVTGPDTPTVNTPIGELPPGTTTLSGAAAPGASVVVIVDGQPVGTTTAGSDGAWALEVALAGGQHEVQSRTVDAAGNIMMESDTVVIVVAQGDQAQSGGPEGQPAGNIGQALQESGQFNTLLAAVAAAGLGDALAGQGPLTVFAPTDAAFAALPQQVVDGFLANPQALSTLLLGHVVSGRYTTADLLSAGQVTSLAGNVLTVTSDSGRVLVNGSAVISPDVPASNGLIDVMDKVLLPPAQGVAPPVIDESGVPTFTGNYLTVVGSGLPGATILLQLNGQDFGAPATVDPTGFWLVADTITPGAYEIIAYMLDANGAFLVASEPVMLTAP